MSGSILPLLSALHKGLLFESHWGALLSGWGNTCRQIFTGGLAQVREQQTQSNMQTLRNNNAMLTTALEESTQHVAEWKRQLQKYKEDCDTLKKKVTISQLQ